MNDEELREKTANMKSEEVVSFAKEMGYDFTLEEFTDVMNEDRELSPDELENVAGGNAKLQSQMSKDTHDRGYQNNYKRSNERNYNRAHFCHGVPNGPRHQFVLSIEDRAQFFGAWTKTYAVYECSVCHYKSEYHIKFGEGGEIIRVD